MRNAGEYLQLALENVVASKFDESMFYGEVIPVLPIRQSGTARRLSVTWSLMRGPAGFVDTIDGSSPLTRTYLIEIHYPLKPKSGQSVPEVKMMACGAVSKIERLSEAIRIEIAVATGAVAVEYDEASDASQQRDGYISRQLEITLPAEFLPCES